MKVAASEGVTGNAYLNLIKRIESAKVLIAIQTELLEESHKENWKCKFI